MSTSPSANLWIDLFSSKSGNSIHSSDTDVSTVVSPSLLSDSNLMKSNILSMFSLSPVTVTWLSLKSTSSTETAIMSFSFGWTYRYSPDSSDLISSSAFSKT